MSEEIIRLDGIVKVCSNYESDSALILKVGFKFNLKINGVYSPGLMKSISTDNEGAFCTIDCIVDSKMKAQFELDKDFEICSGPNVLGTGVIRAVN